MDAESARNMLFIISLQCMNSFVSVISSTIWVSGFYFLSTRQDVVAGNSISGMTHFCVELDRKV